ncbi:MAG: DUF1553 domain-containing protein [Planctomycetaceae bacterium]
MITRSEMIGRCLVAMLTILGGASVALSADNRVDYETQIKPMLRERCFSCHGALQQKSGLRLDTVELMLRGGESGAVITRGDVSKSMLIERVTATDISQRMPPEHEGEPFSSEQVQLLREWIADGALSPTDEQPDPDPKAHWAFRSVERPATPQVANAAWVKNPIDAFLSRQHEQHELTPQPEAPRAILLRRLHMDLIGIPPTAEEIAAFDADTSAEWYEKSVERLLNDPRHGERWGRHWMDIWRYSDWWGLGDQLRNSQKHIWHWRDWIIESLNNDASYDEMVRLMLAADELYPNDLDKLRATGYLARNYFLFNRNQWMEETVEHVSKGFLGLTLNCAKCHDHKYDPFAHADFYKMRAFFEPYHVRLDVAPGEADLNRDGIPRVYDGHLDLPTYRFVRGQENSPDKTIAIAPGVPEMFTFRELAIQPVPLPVEAWQPERRPWVLEAYLAESNRNVGSAESAAIAVREKLGAATDNLATAEQELHIAELAVSVAQAERTSIERCSDAMRVAWAKSDAAGTKNQSMLEQAEHDAAKAAVRAERAVTIARARHAIGGIELRLLSANADQKPAVEKELNTAREALNTAAKQLDEPGEQYTKLTGATWTATRFFNSSGDDPNVVFPPNSTGRRTALANWITDRRTPLTARVAVNHIWMRQLGTPLVPTVFDFGRKGIRPANQELLDWLAAELMDNGWSMKHLHRVIVNSAAYRMSSSVAGGDANLAKDPDNRYLWRRTPIRLESQLVRDSVLSLAGTLDETMGGPTVPAAEQADSRRRSLYFFHSNNDRNLFLTTFDEALVKDCYRREQSIVPQQALALTNSRLTLDAAPQIAQRLSGIATDDAEFIRTAFLVILGIQANDAEVAASQTALDDWRKLAEASQDGQSFIDGRAYFIWVLLNHNDFVTLR